MCKWCVFTARDVTAELADKGINDVNHFDWMAQLRYYWQDEECPVRMITTELAYGNEYLGNSGRLVITPLTDRCYRCACTSVCKGL